MKAVGIILAGGLNDRLGELVSQRATSAMPVGSCYRAIDFSLSSMANSNIGKVAIITQYNSRSLHDHLSSAKWWDLGRKQGGLFVLSPYMTSENSQWFRGTADCIYQNLSFLKKSNEPYVVIASGDTVCKMDFDEIIKYHADKEAELTVVYKKAAAYEDVKNFGVLEVDDDGKILDFEEKPLDPATDLISTGIYIVQRTVLIKLLEAVLPESRYDLVKDIIIRYRKRLKLYGYRFDGYWRALNSISAYFETNMDFLKKDLRDLFTKKYPYIETKPKDEPPAKYNYGADVHDCLVGSGSILNGQANHCVIFRKVFTGDNSVVKNSVIMEGSYISNNCVVENAILDKEVVLSDGKRVVGTPEAPAFIPKGTVI